MDVGHIELKGFVLMESVCSLWQAEGIVQKECSCSPRWTEGEGKLPVRFIYMGSGEGVRGINPVIVKILLAAPLLSNLSARCKPVETHPNPSVTPCFYCFTDLVVLLCLGVFGNVLG